MQTTTQEKLLFNCIQIMISFGDLLLQDVNKLFTIWPDIGQSFWNSYYYFSKMPPKNILILRENADVTE